VPHRTYAKRFLIRPPTPERELGHHVYLLRITWLICYNIVVDYILSCYNLLTHKINNLLIYGRYMEDKKLKIASEIKKNNLEMPDKRNILRFLNKSYDESVTLLIYARDYFTTQAKVDRSTFSLEQKLACTFALSTITTQLTSVISWLMFCKALEKGEVVLAQVRSEDLTMPEFTSPMNEEHNLFGALNTETVEIIEKTTSLYSRIRRMEKSVRERLIELA